jgi:hypothetical protein
MGMVTRTWWFSDFSDAKEATADMENSGWAVRQVAIQATDDWTELVIVFEREA